jgi:ABC transporter substrate binding protein
MRRRKFITLLGGAAAAWPLAGAADARPRLAFLGLGAQQNVQHLSFFDGLRRLGYAQGRNLDIDHRYGDVEKLKPLAQELIALKPDILVADSPSGAIAFKSVAPTLPIVCLALTDAGIPDLFASYARPGGNVTGMAQSVEGVTGKLVEVALEIIPGARRIGFLSNPRGASMPLFAESVDIAARARGIAVLTEQVATGGELASVFARFGKQGVQAVIVPVNGLFFSEVTSVHGRSVLELALLPLEANFALPLVHEIASENDRAMLDIAVAAETNLVGDPALMAAEAAREAGNSPNTVMAAAAAIVGPKRVQRTLSCATKLIDLFAYSGLLDARDESFDLRAVKVDANTRALVAATPAEANDPRPEAMLKAVRDRGGKSLFLKFLESLDARPSRDAILAAIATTIAWGPLMRKRISRLTAETLPWYLRLYGVMIGASIPGRHHQSGSLCGISREERFSRWGMADVLFLALTSKKPSEAEARPLQILIGLLISNGPGSISAQGAKGAVAADGPQTPSRVQINKAMVGFLTHSGYSHGGNGFEGMSFLLEQFKAANLKDPTDRNHGIDLKAMAVRFAETYKEQKSQSKEAGLDGPRALPGVHHPIFRGKPVNYDPRERFIAEFMEKRGDYNIFHAYYRELVQALYEAGASHYVFCVNVDAVIAALLLGVLWKDYRSGALTEKDLETAAFNVFLYGRMIGAAAEIDDHLNRGRNMDTRTPQEQCAFVV